MSNVRPAKTMHPSIYRTLAVLSTAVVLAAFANTPMYEGPPRQKEEVARFFTHSPRANMRILTLDGKPLDFQMVKVLELTPGSHVFEVRASNFRQAGGFIVGLGVVTTPITRTYEVGQYRIEAVLRAGQTYTVDYPMIHAGPLPEKLCIHGEPHDAPGKSENWSQEFRTMSSNAQVVGCGPLRDKQEIKQ
jgi:hypothetical protein